MARGLPVLSRVGDFRPGETLTICAAGPSLREFLPVIRERKHIMAAGSAHAALLAAEIAPRYAVALDPKPEMASAFAVSSPDTHYYIASMCDPSVFDALAGRNVTVWVAEAGVDLQDAAAARFRVNVGCTVTIRCWSLGFVLGFRDFEFFGFDACLMGGARHAVPERNSLEAQGEGADEMMDIVVAGRRFDTTSGLAMMAYDWIEVCKHFGHLFTVAVHGDGLISWIMHRKRGA